MKKSNAQNTNGIPLIFVHKGNPLYLRCTLIHAARTQPKSRIILLTEFENNTKSADVYPNKKAWGGVLKSNEIPKNIRSRIEIYNIDDYLGKTNNFKEIYRHMSPNTYDFELICFLRWFIIFDFAETHSITKFFCCDTDMLAYSDLTQIADTRLHGKEISIVNKIGPLCTFFTLQSIKKFCSFIKDQYSNKDNLARLQNIYKEKQENHLGGICDMTMFPLFEETNPNSIHDFGIIENGATFDNKITDSDGFELKGQMKKLSFKNGSPYGTLISTKEKIKFDVLHFQGGEKRYIGKYAKIPFLLKIKFAIKYFNLQLFIINHTSEGFRNFIHSILKH